MPLPQPGEGFDEWVARVPEAVLDQWHAVDEQRGPHVVHPRASVAYQPARLAS
jgi:hypothetical protein